MISQMHKKDQIYYTFNVTKIKKKHQQSTMQDNKYITFQSVHESSDFTELLTFI
jgi:hypothetical protein